MSFELHDRQREVRDDLTGPERHNLIYGGSRSGKTFLFCYAVGSRALQAPNSRHLIGRLHNVDVRQSIMMDTWPTVRRLAWPGANIELNKSDQVAFFENGSEIWFGGLDEKERVDKVLGKEYATIYLNEVSQIPYTTILTLRTRLAQSVVKLNGRPLKQKMYYDLNPVGKDHWTYKEFVELKRPDNDLPIPKETRKYSIINPDDNPRLDQEYLDELDALPERYRKRFKLGEYLTEVPNTLWPLDIIEENRVNEPPELTRIIVGVDPSGSDGSGGDSQGIVAAGLGVDGHGYVLNDWSCRMAPEGWGRRVVDLYGKLQADLIVAEINYGGAMVEHVIRSADHKAAYKTITASRGKHVRAEPVSALYGQNRVHHVGHFPALEEQLGMMTTEGYQGGGSPDRLDACVWAITELMLNPQPAKPVFGTQGLARRSK